LRYENGDERHNLGNEAAKSLTLLKRLLLGSLTKEERKRTPIQAIIDKTHHGRTRLKRH